MKPLSLAFSLATLATAQTLQGFNHGATDSLGTCRGLPEFTYLFNLGKQMPGTNNAFTSARLYTTIQCGTANDPISAFQAAIDTDTNLLLGLWASAGPAQFNNEIVALQRAIAQYGPALASRIVGISVGSEDLYRSSAQGVANNAGVGTDAAALLGYIARVRDVLANTAWAGVPVGHVDTWTAWVLPENRGVADAVDWLGHNSFPYFEATRPNGIGAARELFFSALAGTESVAGGKPVWVTETGWPYVGPQSREAVASAANAEAYWKGTGCELFGTRNTFWYTLADANSAQTNIRFGVAGDPPTANPVFDLSCPA